MCLRSLFFLKWNFYAITPNSAIRDVNAVTALGSWYEPCVVYIFLYQIKQQALTSTIFSSTCLSEGQEAVEKGTFHSGVPIPSASVISWEFVRNAGAQNKIWLCKWAPRGGAGPPECKQAPQIMADPVVLLTVLHSWVKRLGAWWAPDVNTARN